MNGFHIKQGAVSACEPLVRQVKDTIETHEMIAPGQSVLVGLSGGADSTALLFALFTLAVQHGWSMGVGHVHHGLRKGQADLDADFARGLARSLNLPYYIMHVDLPARCRREKISLEEAGRKERYAFFSEIAKTRGYNRIAVGHHKDDTAEQVMMNLLRGCGSEGLTGIAPVREKIIRPLIRVSRSEIESFLRQNYIVWREDDSNSDDRFTRNRIRNRLIPELQTYNPQITAALCRLAKTMREENDWIDQILAPVFQQAVLKQGPEYLVLCAETIAVQPEAAARRLLRMGIRQVKGDLRRIGSKHVEQILSQPAENRARSRQFHLPGQIRVSRDDSRIVLTREKKSLRSVSLSGRQYETVDFAYRVGAKDLAGGNACVRIAETGARLCFQLYQNSGRIEGLKSSANTALMDSDKVGLPLTIRNPRPGDRFVPLGMQGTVKLKDFFINNKIPRHERGRIPVVHSPEGIVWVGGLRIDQSVKVSEGTTNILKIEIAGLPATFQHQTDFRKDF